MVGKVALGDVFSKYLGFPCPCTSGFDNFCIEKTMQDI
jgi:hypothetical protein